MQAESIVPDRSEIKNTSMLSGQELPTQCANENEGVYSVHEASDANGDPSKDSNHTIDAENMTVDEPDCFLDSVEVNTVGEANDINGHLSQVDHNRCLLQYSFDLWSLDFLHIHDRALFELHQTKSGFK